MDRQIAKVLDDFALVLVAVLLMCIIGWAIGWVARW